MPIATKVIISFFCSATLFLMVTAILAYQMQKKYPKDTSDTFDSHTARTFIKVMIAGGLLGMLSTLSSGLASIKGKAGL
jgi:uncharacterized iron-regulated membrane protein